MDNPKSKINRRDFISKGVSGIAAVSMMGTSVVTYKASEQQKALTQSRKKIIYRSLGNTGIRLPIVNMGVMNSSLPALVKKSYDIGVRYFDTAAWYQRGKNEKMIGQAIKELNVRNRVVIGTKIYIPPQQRGMSSEQVKKTYLKIAEQSLQRLQTDYVDILFSHSVYDHEWLQNPGILEALQLLKKQGKARFIGFTTHTNMAECIQDAIRTGDYDVIETAYNYALSDDKDYKNILKKAALKGIGLIAMKTQCSQYWYKEDLPQDQQEYYQGRIMHTAVLKWVLRNNFITTAIPGYTSFREMEEDFSVAYDLAYTSEEKAFLQDRNVKLSLGYCCQCYYCVATCPKKIDIPTLMRTHMYAKCYGNFYQARDTIDDIPEERGLAACITCDQCLAKCTNGIDIGQRIDELKVIFT